MSPLELAAVGRAELARKGYAYDSPLDAGTDLPTARGPAPDAREKTALAAETARKKRMLERALKVLATTRDAAS